MASPEQLEQDRARTLREVRGQQSAVQENRDRFSAMRAHGHKETQGKKGKAEFEGYMLALIVMLIKDIADVFIAAINVIPIIGFVIALILRFMLNIAVGILLFVIFLFEGNDFKRKVIKKMWGRLILVFGLESIPIVSIIPWSAISVFYMKNKTDKTK